MTSYFDEAFIEIEQAVRGVLKEFTKWCGDSWLIDNRDMRGDERYSDEYMSGWNAAMTDGLQGALENFLDEYQPR